MAATILVLLTLLTSCTIGFAAHRTLQDDAASRRRGLPIIDDLILSNPNLTTLALAFETANLVGALCTDCNYTIFGPSNDAFTKIDEDYLNTLLSPNYIYHLQNLLSFHATVPTNDRLLTTDLVDGQVIE